MFHKLFVGCTQYIWYLIATYDKSIYFLTFDLFINSFSCICLCIVCLYMQSVKCTLYCKNNQYELLKTPFRVSQKSNQNVHAKSHSGCILIMEFLMQLYLWFPFLFSCLFIARLPLKILLEIIINYYFLTRSCDTQGVAFSGRSLKVCNTFFPSLVLVSQQDVAHFVGRRIRFGCDFLTKMPILRIGQHRGNELRCLQLQLGQTLLQQLVALHQLDSL